MLKSWRLNHGLEGNAAGNSSQTPSPYRESFLNFSTTQFCHHRIMYHRLGFQQYGLWRCSCSESERTKVSRAENEAKARVLVGPHL